MVYCHFNTKQTPGGRSSWLKQRVAHVAKCEPSPGRRPSCFSPLDDVDYPVLLLCFMLVGQAVAQSQDRGSCLAAAATHQSLTLQIISPAGCLHPYVRKLLVSREAHCTRLPILMCRRWCQHGGRRGGYLCTAALPSSRHEVILPHVCLFSLLSSLK